MNKRIVGLDFIRCTAIISVFWYHGSLLFPNELQGILELPLILPFDGVSTFFVLSGFLIGNIFLKNFNNLSYSIKDLFNFWKRRWWRTLPLYFFILLTLIFLQFDKWNYQWSFFIFSHKLIPGSSPGFFAVAWSLAVEEWFYFLFPVLVFFTYKLTKKKSISFLFVTVLFFIIPFMLRLYYHYFQGLEFWQFRHITTLRLDGIMYGVIAAYSYNSHPKVWEKLKTKSLYLGIIWIVAFSLLDIKGVDSNILETFRFSIEAISVLLFLPYLNSLKSLKNSSITKVITFISKTSYSMYLIHANIVLWIFIRFIEEKSFLGGLRFEFQRIILFVIYTFTSLILSWVMYYYLEKPVLKLRDKFTKKELK